MNAWIVSYKSRITGATGSMSVLANEAAEFAGIYSEFTSTNPWLEVVGIKRV